MNQRTDFGWFLYGTDEPLPHLSSPNFSGGLFSATTTDPIGSNLFLLDSPNPVAARVGKNGGNSPLNADGYRLFAIRMNVGEMVRRPSAGRATTSRTGRSVQATDRPDIGWRTYLVNMAALGNASGPLSGAEPCGPSDNGGLLRALQLYLSFNSAPISVQIIDPPCEPESWTLPSCDVVGIRRRGGPLSRCRRNTNLLASGVTNNTASAVARRQERVQPLCRRAGLRVLSGARHQRSDRDVEQRLPGE